MSQKNFLDKRGLTYFYDKINSSYLIKYQNMSTNKTDLAVIATKYDSTSTYSIGDYCVYQEKLYKCSTNIGIAETWNGQHWTEVTISDELENIYNLFEDVLLKPQVSGTQGQVLTADGQGGQSWEDSIASGIAASDANEDGNIIINNTINVELDERPIEDSVNGVTSGGVYDELENIRDNLSQKYEKPSTGIPSSDLATGVIPDVPVQDVTVNGTSVLGQGGVAEIPLADTNTDGVVSLDTSHGITLRDDKLSIAAASSSMIKNGTNGFFPVCPIRQHESTFYGLAKAAGDSTQTQSDNTVGTYTDEAKSAIKTMLGIDMSSLAPFVEEVSGTTPVITAEANVRYVCGEVSTIDITPPSVGTCDITFISGSTPTVLTIPSTILMPEWFDATSLEADTLYEIMITDSSHGMVMSWAM